MDQIISLAEVRDRADASRNGSFLARIWELGNEEKRVQYVSPYASNGEGAFIGIPEVGTEVLVCKPGGGDDWYYLGATFTPEPLQVVGPRIPDDKLLPMDRAAPLLYRARGEPMSVQLTGREGGGLIVGEDYNPGFINNRTEIRSNVNKKIILSDAPAIDAIILDSGNGSKITIADDPQNNSVPSRSIQVESVGPQKYINIESQTDVLVKDGRELQLLNNSTGAKAPEGEPDKAGNVNVQSKWKDINVFTQAEQGRIFIECLNGDGGNQQIVIETNGANGAITIKTNGNVNIDAGQDINMKAGGNMNIGCTNFSVNATDNIQMQGQQVNIDPGNGTIELANGATPTTPIIPNPQSIYDNEGITTY